MINPKKFNVPRRKYKNTIVHYKGKKFDSIKEHTRYLLLKDMESKGEISELQTQVTYHFDDNLRYINKEREGRRLSYRADFVYCRNGLTVVEDVKGFITPEYRIKKALMKFFHNIEIEEV